MTVATGTRYGFHLTGEFLSIKPGKAWTSKQDGVTRTPSLVTLLAGGDRTVQVEYRDEASASEAVALAGGRERGDIVMLPIFARAKGKDWLSISGVNIRAGE
jgi:hypothetical protein